MVYLCISVQLRVRDITTMNLPKPCISMQLRVRDRRRLTYHKEFFIVKTLYQVYQVSPVADTRYAKLEL